MILLEVILIYLSATRERLKQLMEESDFIDELCVWNQ